MISKQTIEVNSIISANQYTLVELSESVDCLTRIIGINADGFDIDYRISKDCNNWNEWKPWPTTVDYNLENVWIAFRFFSSETKLLKDFEFVIDGKFSSDCTCKVTPCGSSNSNSDNSFLTSCNSSSLYNTAFGAMSLYGDLSCAVFNNTGWPVLYFKVNEIEESKDVIFNEHSLLKVESCKQIKVVVPNNDFSAGDFQFTEYDVDFGDELIVQVHKESFWASFGLGQQPEEKDFLYFPLERRMYRVNSVQQNKGFMRQVNWFDLNLVKYNQSDSIYKSDDVLTTIDELTLSYNDFNFEEEQYEEEIDVVKPQQYVQRRIGDSDNCREFIDINWEKYGITEQNLMNYYTVFSKYQYNLERGVSDIKCYDTSYNPPNPDTYDHIAPLITYQSTVDGSKDFSVMFWYNPKSRVELDDVYIKLFGDNPNIETKTTLDQFTGLKFGNTEFNFSVPTNDWYGIYIGQNECHNELTLRIWSRKDVSEKTTKMDVVFEQTVPIEVFGEFLVSLYSSPVNDEITSIRFFKNVATIEKQVTMFNKMIVKDASMGYIIDNAYPMSYLGFLSSK